MLLLAAQHAPQTIVSDQLLLIIIIGIFLILGVIWIVNPDKKKTRRR